MLEEFRSSVLSRAFNRNFQENPESHILQDRMQKVNSMVNDLKSKSNEHSRYLRELVEKHSQYNSSVEGLMGWLPDAERKFNNLENEPIGADPITIKKQIEHLKVRGHG